MNYNVLWTSSDAIAARKKVVKAAKYARVHVPGITIGHFVRITKANAYKLLDTGEFKVSGSDADDTADLELLK